MKKILALISALVVMSAFALVGCAPKDDIEYINKRGKMVIGITIFDPMNYYDKDGSLIGFDTEFARLVAAELGVDAEFQVIDWNLKETELKSRNIDCIWNGLTVNESRKNDMDFSVSYVVNKQCAVIKSENAAKYTTLESIAGAKIAAEKGSAGEDAVKGEDVLKNANYTAMDDQAKVLLEVNSGTTDVGIIDLIMASASIGPNTSYSNLMVVDTIELTSEEYAIGFRKGSSLTAKVNEIIAKLAAEDKIKEIAEKYDLLDKLTDSLK